MKPCLQKLGLAIVTTAFAAPSALASVSSGANAAKPASTPDNLFGGPDSAFQLIANTLIFLVGAVAVIMLIIGGFRYVTSQGSSEQIKQAKDTILYGIIGVIVAILSYAIVNFIASTLK